MTTDFLLLILQSTLFYFSTPFESDIEKANLLKNYEKNAIYKEYRVVPTKWEKI